MDYYAHTLPDKPCTNWEKVEDHLSNVAHQAKQFAEPFNAGSWGELAGRWHDLGKFSKEFQQYLRKNSKDEDASLEEEKSCLPKVDHSTAGAQYAAQAIPVIGYLLAFVIAGHHGGLLNARDSESCLEARLKKHIPDWENHAPRDLKLFQNLESPEMPRDAFKIAFWTRFLFSCLVDADYLATEAFMDSTKSEQRPQISVKLDELLQTLDSFLNQKENDSPKTVVNNERRQVRKACLQAAEKAPGFFTLMVPTGGGKTLSSLAFALKHAKKNGLKRVIYAIPYTSIIEQTSAILRDVFHNLNPDPVLEHHSNLDSEADHITMTSRLATENWDAPLKVTTNVQFFESLFANKPSSCRKLHRIANSVIILDEAQTLPVEILKPCLETLKTLVKHFNCTVVLCTATQPALLKREGEFEIGLENVKPIIPDTKKLFQVLKRTKIQDIGKIKKDILSKQLSAVHQVLCVVNTRSQAKQLFQTLGENIPEHFHLSALMCPSHRSQVIETIRHALREGLPCRVVSTQLIEAGVDIDFPIVYRTISGMDSIAQAAGRCNREGKLPCGDVYIFDFEDLPSPKGSLRQGIESTTQILPLYRDDLLTPPCIEHYFRLHYWSQSTLWDKKRVLECFQFAPLPPQSKELPFLFNFSDAAERFQMIETSQKPVIIPWKKEGEDLVKRMRLPDPAKGLHRQAQRFTVQIPQWTWAEAVAQGSVEILNDRFPVLVSPDLHYSNKIGLKIETAAEVLIV